MRIPISALLLLLVGPAFAQVDQLISPLGGNGGGAFIARCEKGDILNGFDLRTGDDVDWIRPICVTVRGPTFRGERRVFTTGFGGSGGNPSRLICPDEGPAIAGLWVGYEGEATTIVNSIYLYCSVALPNRPQTTHPTAVFSGPVTSGWGRFEPTMCPPGLVPVGIHGRSGIWLDSLGLICGALPFDGTKYGEPVKSIGRLGPPSTPRPARSICEAARDARARNSPAAANLEAQCAALPPPVKSPPLKSIGKVATTSVSTTPTAPRSICEAAADARARNSPAAVNLEAQCRAAGGPKPAALSEEDLDAVMARGEALAMEDPLAAELRNRAPEGPIRRGFDIGLGIWEVHTADGPGKQRYRDTLNYLEQRGFKIAANYAMPRNKHAALAAVGAAIAGAQAEVAEARVAEDDVMFWLGFDIAGGIFGDPAAGSLGNTATGPGSVGIRKDLDAAGRRGFDAATALHLSRRYQ